MRSKDFGIIQNVSQEFSPEESLGIFKKVCLSRFFEFNVKKAFDQGLIKMPIYLSVGQEAIAAALAVSFKNPAIFGQHRCHDFYLSYGGEIIALIDELLYLPTGCAKGMGGSASIHSPAINMFGHDGLMGTQIPIAVGYALGTGKKTLAIMGDASAEEDYVLGALGYAAHKKAPVLFVCVDNGLSILTKVEVRRNWKIADVAASFGMNSMEITDDPWLIMHHIRNFILPAFLNIHTVRHLWHSGTGVDGTPEWDRYGLVKDELQKLGLKSRVDEIEEQTRAFLDHLWDERIKLSPYFNKK